MENNNKINPESIFGFVQPYIRRVLENSVLYTVDISQSEHMMSEGIKKYFTNVPDKLFIEACSEKSNDGLSFKYQKNIGAWDPTASNISSTILWKGVPMNLTVKLDDRRETSSTTNRLMMSTINNEYCKKTLKEFIRHLARIQHKRDVKTSQQRTILYTLSNHGIESVYMEHFKRRTFENTFIPKEQEDLIKNTIDKFKHSRNWYKHNNIPYHLGFLLYSGAGTGKTSIAQAIAEYAKAELISFPGDAINELPRVVGRQLSRSPLDKNCYRVLLIEDIDCAFTNNTFGSFSFKRYDNDENETERKLGFAAILNTLDGISAPENVIYVFTTNHVEKLDPALIRPGRCDIKLEIPGITAETFNRFCEYHYKHAFDCKLNNDEIRDDITFAALQIEVMKGKSPEDLVNIIRKEEN